MKKYFLSVGVGLIVIAILFSGYKYVGANASRITAPNSCTTSGTAATTSVSYLTAGTGTTTVTCNLQYIAQVSSGVESTDSAVLGIQFLASSTASSELNWYLEYSQDGVDWYKENVFTQTATTTIATSKTYAWRQYSTTTPISVSGYSTSSLDRKLVNIESPTRYVRATFTQPIGSLAGAVWAQFIGKSQRIDK